METHEDSLRLIETHEDSVRLIKTCEDSLRLIESHMKEKKRKIEKEPQEQEEKSKMPPKWWNLSKNKKRSGEPRALKNAVRIETPCIL